MRTLACVCAIAIFIAVLTPGAYARVIGGDLENGVAVYYFSSFTNLENILDHSGNGLTGSPFSGAQLGTVSGRHCLSLGSNVARFQAQNDNKPLSVLRKFSIVAWVKVPQQLHDFLIEIYAYNGRIDSVSNAEGTVTLGVGSDDSLYGEYAYYDKGVFHDAQSIGRNINNNQWQHIGFVVNSTSMKLYLNGIRVVNHSVSGLESFRGTGTLVVIGENAKGNVDDVGFFKNDLTDTQVRFIYNSGLSTIVSIASVDPSGKVATTWGALKQR